MNTGIFLLLYFLGPVVPVFAAWIFIKVYLHPVKGVRYKRGTLEVLVARKDKSKKWYSVDYRRDE